MALLTAAILVAQAEEVQVDPAEEGKKVIIGMLVTGLIFIGEIALGQLSKWASHRSDARRARTY